MDAHLATARGRKKPVTLRDIAALVDTDLGTVSRALAGNPGVSKDRSAQIRAYAEALGYRPRPLRRKRADAIGLVVRVLRPSGRPMPNPGHLERMVALAEMGAAERGNHLHIHMLKPDSEEGMWPKFISENRVDGVLMLGHGTSAFYERLAKEPIAAVAINDTTERTGIDCVLSDPTPGIRDAVGRLLSLGHTTIGLVLTRREYATVSRRLDAYLAVLREAGIEPDARWVIQDVPEGLRGGQQAIRTYVATHSVPTAILFNDDWIAMGGAYELARQGIRIPQDVSIVGYDNTAISEDLQPSLTSVENHESQMMLRAIEMLQERIGGFDGPPRQIVLPSSLIWRESCAHVGGVAVRPDGHTP